MSALQPSLLGPALLSVIQQPSFVQSLWAALPTPQEEHWYELARAPSPALATPPEPLTQSLAEFLHAPSLEEQSKTMVAVSQTAVSSHPASADSPSILPFSWCDLPQAWEFSYGEDNRLVAWFPDDSSNYG